MVLVVEGFVRQNSDLESMHGSRASVSQALLENTGSHKYLLKYPVIRVVRVIKVSLYDGNSEETDGLDISRYCGL